MPSSTKRLKTGQPLPYDLVLAGGRIRFRKGTIISDEILRIIKDGKVVQVSVEAPIVEKSESDRGSFRSDSEKRLKQAYRMNLARSALKLALGPQRDSLHAVQESLIQMWRDPSRTLNPAEIMASVDRWVSSMPDNRDCLTTIGWNTDPASFLAGHMVNVARFTSCMASELGFKSDHIREITLAALLHDIGEMFIEKEILMSSRKFDSHQISRIRQHPKQSVEWLKRAGINLETVHRLVLRHHERFDGSGYPYNITGKVLNLDDMLVAISDVYIALIGRRPHRESNSRREALRQIMRMKGRGFSEDMVTKLVGILGLYPPGSLVGLKSGGTAVVLATPSNGTWDGLLVNDTNNSRKIEPIDLNHLSGDYIIREYA